MMHPPGTATPLPELHRSNLIVPVTQQRFVESAHRRGADCVTLDLEDESGMKRERACEEGVGTLRRACGARRLPGRSSRQPSNAAARA